ncbi:PREDICTED: RNA polymerase II C-terminal domain phosphatase-like 4 [Camelina sativa]|uniref:RNA polymerase II C-terminal domain phosphatase-like n=1 Tax=Camelina sativa TaxID=90675 RepID=A0ABM0VYQ3_CAMSA|nr:PREDICTED: RNA polymerase II C-terminal domain phosphatase-like 4 [Camelina sativa]
MCNTFSKLAVGSAEKRAFVENACRESTASPQPKSKRQEESSSSSLCLIDDFVKRLQQLNLAYDAATARLTELASLNDNKKKKLHLVLDLDHTLIHSTLVSDFSIKEKYLLEEDDSRLDLWRCNEYMIKLRPFVHEFLLEAKKLDILFTMHVYTMGSSSYVKMVLMWIDPDKVYFRNRVITREASPYYKTLHLVKADKRRVVIVDDTIDVWPYHQRNLLQITRYKYFRDAGTMSESYAEAKKDESRRKGSLAYVLKFLKHVHKRFEEELDCKDLRPLIPAPCTQCCF